MNHKNEPRSTASAASEASKCFKYDEFPCKAKNPKLSVRAGGWEEQRTTMLIFWFGMFQLASLVSWIVAALIGIRWVLIQMAMKLDIEQAPLVASSVMIILAGPVGWMAQDVIGKSLVALISQHLDTIWSWMLLGVFAPNPSSIVHDGLPCGKGVNFLRTTFNEEDDSIPTKLQSMYVVYPCQDERDDYLHRRQPMKYSWDSWNLRQSSTEDIKNELLKQGMIKKGNSHAIVYVHGGGFVAANAAVLMQQAIPMARNGHGNVVFSLNYPLAPVYPFPSAVASVLQALSYIQEKYGVTHVTLVGDSAGGSIVSYSATLLTSAKFYQRFRDELPSYYGGSDSSIPWPNLRSGKYETIESYPKIITLVSIYGVMDGRTCLEQPPLTTITVWENFLARHGLKFCLECYDSRPSDDARLPAHVVELWTSESTRESFDLNAMPSTLLICGTCDPLVASTTLAASILTSAHLQFFTGRHALVGLPRAWVNWKLKSQASQADALVQTFIANGIDQRMK